MSENSEYQHYVNLAISEANQAEKARQAYDKDMHMRRAEFWAGLASSAALNSLSSGFLPAEIFVDKQDAGPFGKRFKVRFMRR